MDMYYSLTLVATLPISQVRGNSGAWFWEAFADVGLFSHSLWPLSPLVRFGAIVGLGSGGLSRMGTILSSL